MRATLVPGLIAAVLALAGCGASSTGGITGPGLGSTGVTPGADPFVAACEGDVGSRIEAHCNCIESAVTGTVSQAAIQRELGNIRAGNPPAWFMAAASGCPS